MSKVRVGNTIISQDMVRMVLAFLGVYIAFVIAGGVFLGTQGHDMLTALSASASAVGNVGPGFGTIGPTENFSHFSDFSKICVIFADALR